MNGGLFKYKPYLQNLNTEKREGVRVKFIFLNLDFELTHCGLTTLLVSDTCYSL